LLSIVSTVPDGLSVAGVGLKIHVTPGLALENPARPIPVEVKSARTRQRRDMRVRRLFLAVAPLILAGTLTGCSETNKSPDVTENIRKSLDQAGYRDVSVSQDREKGVVTLKGTVPTEGDKAEAESLAKSAAGPQVVANQIAVRPPGNESDAKAVDSDMDKAIEKNLDAMLTKNKMKKGVRYDVKNGVVTLKGDVPSQSRRTQLEKLASDVPNVKQVVNELEVKGQKASSTS
jgi:hyperosmotically inducible periplasmic protein